MAARAAARAVIAHTRRAVDTETKKEKETTIKTGDTEASLVDRLSLTLKNIYIERRYIYETWLIVKEMLIYGVFLTVFSLVIMYTRPSEEAFYLSDAMKVLFVEEEWIDPYARIFTDWENIANAPDWWMWMEWVVTPYLFMSSWYGDRMDGYIYGSNRVLGTPRLRQVRVRSDSCDVQSRYKDYFPDPPKGCFEAKPDSDQLQQDPWVPGHYDASTNLTETFPYSFATGNDLPFEYYSSSELDEVPRFWGQVSWITGSGYTISFPMDEADSGCRTVCDKEDVAADTCVSTKTPNVACTRNLKLVEELEYNNWIDYGTRAVFLDFTLYNANMDKYLICRFLAEFPGSGGVVTSQTFRVIDFDRYDGDDGVTIASLELWLVCFVLYYMTEEILEIRELGFARYCRHGWNYLDWVNITIFIVAFVMRMYAFAAIYGSSVDWDPVWSTDPDLNQFSGFEKLGFVFEQEYNWLAINCFLCYFKVFKYLTLSPNMMQLVRTLSASAGECVYFCACIVIVLLGYAVAGNLVFGTKLEYFRTLTQSLWFLFRASIGDIDFDELYEANRVFGPLFYVTFILLVQFVLVNMFIAIVSNAYELSRTDPDQFRAQERATAIKNELGRWKDKLQRVVDAKRNKGAPTGDEDFHLSDQQLADFLRNDMEYLSRACDSEPHLAKAFQVYFKLTQLQAEAAAHYLFEEFDKNKDGSLVDDVQALRDSVADVIQVEEVDEDDDLPPEETEEQAKVREVKEMVEELTAKVGDLMSLNTAIRDQLMLLRRNDERQEKMLLALKDEVIEASNAASAQSPILRAKRGARLTGAAADAPLAATASNGAAPGAGGTGGVGSTRQLSSKFSSLKLRSPLAGETAPSPPKTLAASMKSAALVSSAVSALRSPNPSSLGGADDTAGTPRHGGGGAGAVGGGRGPVAPDLAPSRPRSVSAPKPRIAAGGRGTSYAVDGTLLKTAKSQSAIALVSPHARRRFESNPEDSLSEGGRSPSFRLHAAALSRADPDRAVSMDGRDPTLSLSHGSIPGGSNLRAQRLTRLRPSAGSTGNLGEAGRTTGPSPRSHPSPSPMARRKSGGGSGVSDSAGSTPDDLSQAGLLPSGGARKFGADGGGVSGSAVSLGARARLLSEDDLPAGSPALPSTSFSRPGGSVRSLGSSSTSQHRSVSAPVPRRTLSSRGPPSVASSTSTTRRDRAMTRTRPAPKVAASASQRRSNQQGRPNGAGASSGSNYSITAPLMATESPDDTDPHNEDEW